LVFGVAGAAGVDGDEVGVEGAGVEEEVLLEELDDLSASAFDL
jgi:hypothetical protein